MACFAIFVEFWHHGGSALVKTRGVAGVDGREEMQEFVAMDVEERPIQKQEKTRQFSQKNKEKRRKMKPLPKAFASDLKWSNDEMKNESFHVKTKVKVMAKA